jgi:hypothetical protein
MPWMPWNSQEMGIMVIWGTCIRVIWLMVNKWLVMVMVNHNGNFNHELVGWWTLLWKMMEFVSWDDDIPNWMEKSSIHVPVSTNQLFFRFSHEKLHENFGDFAWFCHVPIGSYVLICINMSLSNHQSHGIPWGLALDPFVQGAVPGLLAKLAKNWILW